MSPTLAIDFGSTRTKIAYLCPDSGKPEIVELGQEIRSVMPSVFYIPPSGPVLVGDEAAQLADDDPAGIVVDIKREIHRPQKIRCGEGRPAYQRWELVSILFTEIRRRCGEEVFHNGTIDSCTLTVPVCFTEPQRAKLLQAANQAGFTNVKVLEEPVAAAMHWLSSSGRELSDHVIVIDIGGGTTDLAALKLNGNTYEGIPDLASAGIPAGGNDIDGDIRQAMADAPGCNEDNAGALLMKLRQVKERLNLAREDFTISLDGHKLTVPRLVVETAVGSLVEKTRAATSRFLQDFQEVTGRTDTPVLLAGGGSKLAGMKEALEQVAGAGRVFIWNDGEYAIALGAALAAGGQRSDEGRSKLLAELETILTKTYSTEKQRSLVTPEMVRACETEAKNGNARAQRLLGGCHEDGFHVSKDLNEAVNWFRLSADQGDASGQNKLGLCCHAGKGVPLNHNEAVNWFRLSAQQGNASGQQNLGHCYRNGLGVPQNHAEAVKWFRLSAEQGNAMGQYNLGQCYIEGKGVAQNHTEAVKWFRLSADQGNAEAQCYLRGDCLHGKAAPQNQAEKMIKQASNNFILVDPSSAQGSGVLESRREFALGNGQQIAVRYIPAGTFAMGSPASEKGRLSDETQHSVRLSSPYWMGEKAVTQGQWRALMGNNPSRFKGDPNLPVRKVSWHDAQAYLTAINARALLPNGWKWALPTEAQWEYACRAGTTGPYAGDPDEMAWYDGIGTFFQTTHPVATKKPNAWGLYDMHGNVEEWCADWYGDYPISSVTDPTGPSTGWRRVLRGGRWNFAGAYCRSAYRGRRTPGYRGYYIGFRVAAVPAGP